MFHALAQHSQSNKHFIEMLEQNCTCYIQPLTIICIVLFIQVAVVVGFNQERGTSLRSEKTANDLKGFNFLCTSKDDLQLDLFGMIHMDL